VFVLFISSKVTFFRVLLSLACMLVYTIFLCFVNADYFAAFLIAAEVPIILISLLFYFSKHSLQVDSAYAIDSTKIKTRMFFIFFLFLGFFICVLFHSSSLPTDSYLNSAATADAAAPISATRVCPATNSSKAHSYINFSLFFDYTLHELVFFPTRNDFYLLFVVYYNINCFLTFVLGFLLFLVSCVAIFIYFSVKKTSKVTDFSLKNALFLRKQSMLRQSCVNTRLRFFKRKKL
jgi:hypothetical protein